MDRFPFPPLHRQREGLQKPSYHQHERSLAVLLQALGLETTDSTRSASKYRLGS